MHHARTASVALLIATFAVACGGAQLDQGGRLYDKWARAAGIPAKAGAPARLKNLWGWDLRGKAGIYGPDYQNKASVRPENLLEDPRTPAQLKAWLKAGGDGVPAYGAALGEAELDLLVAFIDAMRTGRIARASDVWQLSKSAPKRYTLNPGADPERGKALYAGTCAGCHGADGRRIKIDGVYSVGSFGRMKAYEGWFKVLAGHPGSPMRGQVPSGLDREAQGAFLLDLFAGLCDRRRFPPLEGGKDVSAGDARCGAYLR